MKEEKLFFYAVVVNKVYDGDTITDADIDLGFKVWINSSIRIDGIDCPEIRSKNQAEKELAKKAKEFTETFCLGKHAILYSVKREKFGRVLGKIFVDDKSLGDELIKQGLARKYDGGKRKPWKL